MLDSFVHLRVVYEDLPDLIEVEVTVRHDTWSAKSNAYVSPADFAEDAGRLAEWTKSPEGQMQLEAGSDTGIGWMLLKFYTVDLARHARCAVTLATRTQPGSDRPEGIWRFAIEMPTELGLIERFARQVVALSEDSSKEALLEGVLT